MDKITKTYLIISDTTDYQNPLIGTQSFYYAVEQSTLPDFNLSPIAMSPNHDEIVLVFNIDTTEIFNMFADSKKRRRVACVVQFWGNVSQVFIYINPLLVSREYSSLLRSRSTLRFRFDQQSFSEKSKDNTKYWVRQLVHHRREERLEELLGNDIDKI